MTNDLTLSQQAFADAVESGCERLTAVSPGVCPGCEQCRQDYDYKSLSALKTAYDAGKIVEEPWFSWHACECCGSSLGGDRYEAHGLDADNEIVHFEVCVDCLLYLANGDLPE